MPNNMRSYRSKAQGFSLLEVLIAVLIIAFGLLGMAALQLKTVQNSHSAYQRTIASIIAMDASERMWINLGVDPEVIEDEWLEDWEGTLPAAANTASEIEVLPNGNLQISVRWQENRLADTSGVENFVYTMRRYP